jgi:hypothetical protein
MGAMKATVAAVGGFLAAGWEGRVQGDYTKQLADIAAALRQPTVWWNNAWILASFSAVLGIIGGFVGQLILRMYSDGRPGRRF